MKLEVGKKYVRRHDPSVKYLRVDSIIPDRTDEFDRVDVSIFRFGADIGAATYNENGLYYTNESSQPHDFDIVAEYKEPAINLTPDDVGKRFKLRSGCIRLIVGYNPSSKCPFSMGSGIGSVDHNGRANKERETSDDIVEVLLS